MVVLCQIQFILGITVQQPPTQGRESSYGWESIVDAATGSLFPFPHKYCFIAHIAIMAGQKIAPHINVLSGRDSRQVCKKHPVVCRMGTSKWGNDVANTFLESQFKRDLFTFWTVSYLPKFTHSQGKSCLSSTSSTDDKPSAVSCLTHSDWLRYALCVNRFILQPS